MSRYISGVVVGIQKVFFSGKERTEGRLKSLGEQPIHQLPAEGGLFPTCGCSHPYPRREISNIRFSADFTVDISSLHSGALDHVYVQRMSWLLWVQNWLVLISVLSCVSLCENLFRGRSAAQSCKTRCLFNGQLLLNR